MSDYVLHPEAYSDVDELWGQIAQDSIQAADRVREEIFGAFQKLCPFLIKATVVTSLPVHSTLFPAANILLPMLQTKSPFS